MSPPSQGQGDTKRPVAKSALLHQGNVWQARYQGQQLLQTHSVATGALGQSWECIGIVPNTSTITGHHTNPASMPIRLAYRLGEGEKLGLGLHAPPAYFVFAH